MRVVLSLLSLSAVCGVLPAQSPSTAAGALPQIVLGASDLSAGASLTREGEPDSSAFLLGFTSMQPLESFQRAFEAEQMVFSAGGLQLGNLEVTAMAFHSAAEARKRVEVYELVDVPSLFDAMMGEPGTGQLSVGGSHPVELNGIGEQTRGWVVELVSPLGNADLAILLASRGRVGMSVMAMGPSGLHDADLAALLRTMDDRVRKHTAYLTDVEAERSASVAADAALHAATDVALDAIAAPLDSSAPTFTTATFTRDNGWPEYERSVEGEGLTFPLGRSTAIAVQLTVTLHDTETQALKRVIAAQRDARTLFANFNPLDAGDVAILGGDSSTITSVPASRLGALSHASSARLRGPMRVDMDAVVFARGRLSASVLVIRRPGSGDPSGALAVARDMRQRARNVMPGVAESAPSAALVAAVSRVVDAERAVDSLVRARDLEGAFRASESAGLSQAPVGFSTVTWNRLCRQASLNGHAERAIPACDAAVAPDSTVLTHRDSRGLARALAGDLQGASEDFAYVVAHAAPGEFHDTRAGWLEALRAGENPFTPEVLEQLREN